jgi:hypothetical protein
VAVDLFLRPAVDCARGEKVMTVSTTKNTKGTDTGTEKPKRITDKFLDSFLMADRRVRDYYGENDFGRLTIRLSKGNPAQAIFGRMVICEPKYQHEVIELIRALNVKPGARRQ